MFHFQSFLRIEPLLRLSSKFKASWDLQHLSYQSFWCADHSDSGEGDTRTETAGEDVGRTAEEV